MRDPYEEDSASLSLSKKGEGRSRRRKNWNARKRQVVEAETLVGAIVGEVKEVKRRDCDDNYLRLEMEERRRCRIDQLSSEKVGEKIIMCNWYSYTFQPEPLPDWFTPCNHEKMQAKASKNVVRKVSEGF